MIDGEGLLDLEQELREMLEMASDTDPIIEAGAEAFTTDLLKLAKPRSSIRNSKHTHLIDSFAYKKNKRDKGSYDVGWGAYYGRMVEHGTKFMGAQPHLKPMWERNETKYQDIMIKKLKLN